MMVNEFLLPFQKRLIEEVSLAYEELLNGKNSQGILLIADSGAGKTYSLDKLAEHFGGMVAREDWATTLSVQPFCPVLRYAADAKADAGTMATHLLARLGKHATGGPRQPLGKLEADLLAAMHARRVRLLILEEFHNAILAGAPALRGQGSRMLKNIWNMYPDSSTLNWSKPAKGRDDWRLVIVVSGTEELLPVFEKDRELGSRFSTIISAPKLGFAPPPAFKAFRGVLRKMTDEAGLGGLLDANSNVLASRMLFACNGHLRLLEKLLERTATLNVRQPCASSDELLTLLSRAFQKINAASHSNPFEWAESEIENQVAQAMRTPQSHPKDW